MSTLELWTLIVFLPGLDTALSFFMGIGSIALFAAIGARLVAEDKEDDYTQAAFYRYGKRLGVVTSIWLVLCFAAIVTPDERQIRWMIGGYVVTNIEGVGKLPDNIVGAANEFLERYREADNK